MNRIASLLIGAVVGSTAPAAVAQSADGAGAPIPYFADLQKWDQSYEPPRTADGRPDLQGVWSSASLTGMQRGSSGYDAGPGIDTLVIPQEKIDEITRNAFMNKVVEEEKLPTPASAPPGKPEEGRNLRGYNRYWIDPGSEYAKVNGEYRSSWIVSPANGRIPFSAEGRSARSSRMSAVRNSTNTGPEVRPIGDRCLQSYAGQAGPPLNNGIYNNYFRIVQTPDSVMVNVEMNHDVRIFAIDADRRPDVIKQWFGDSVAHWEGDTLVVETRNLNPTQEGGAFIPVSQSGRVIERFTRVSDLELLYEFTVDDPVYYSEVWKGEMPLRKAEERIHEYACHEGNYALWNILNGMRVGIDTAIDAEGE